MTRKMKHSIAGLVMVLMAVLFGACASPTAKLTVSRNDITAGEAVTVKWETRDGKDITLNGQKVDKIGAQSVSPKDTTKYEIIAKRGKKSARDSATVTVTVVKPPEPKVSLTADKSALDLGQSTTLHWSTENAKIVTITGLGEVPGSGEREISPRASTTYTATALGDGGSATASARVSVTEPPPPPAPTPAPTPPPEPSGADQFRAVAKSVFFDYDKSDLLQPEQDKLRVLAEFLNLDRNRSIAFRIEGNCDPRGTSEYNLGLGDRRSRTIRDFLASLGVDPSRIEQVSYGSEKAQGTVEGTSSSPPSWAYDRRGDFVYLRGGDRP
ncbi:MAG TPA: OmpA family protein [Blastocatellia bacterium]|nr:OmpA family protein [Blastocatellia bacterium]